MESEQKPDQLVPMKPWLRKQWQFGGYEDDRNGFLTNTNPGGHVFRYTPNYDLQRRCVHCGLWETFESRDKPCKPGQWIGAPA